MRRMITSGCGHQHKERIDLSDDRELKNKNTLQHVTLNQAGWILVFLFQCLLTVSKNRVC